MNVSYAFHLKEEGLERNGLPERQQNLGAAFMIVGHARNAEVGHFPYLLKQLNHHAQVALGIYV